MAPPPESRTPSPNRNLSPLRPRPRPTADAPAPKQRTLKDSTGFIRGLWPSSTTTTTTSSSSKKPVTTTDWTGDDKSEDSMFLNRQRSCTPPRRFENERGRISKENHKTHFGGSARYTGKLGIPGRSSISSFDSSSLSPAVSKEIVPGRFFIDENLLRRSLGRRSDTQDSESDCSDMCSGGTSFGSPVTGKISPASYMASTVSSRKSGIEASSNLSTRHRRGTSGLNFRNPLSPNNYPKVFSMKKAKETATSQWRENRGKPTTSFSSPKTPMNPPRAKGVGNLLSVGLDLFRSRKSSPLKTELPETIHQLRVLHNRLVQWRFVNARAEAAERTIHNQAESNLIYAWKNLTNLQQFVLQRKLQLEKEKFQMKLNLILQSQIKSLEAWGDLEKQHLSAVSMTKDCLNSVICMVPLVEGAKMVPHSTSIAIRHASDLATSIRSTQSSFAPAAGKTVSMLSELAEVVAQEKALFGELLELSKIISTLEIQERSLKCSKIQMKLWQQKQQQQQHHHRHEKAA